MDKKTVSSTEDASQESAIDPAMQVALEHDAARRAAEFDDVKTPVNLSESVDIQGMEIQFAIVAKEHAEDLISIARDLSSSWAMYLSDDEKLDASDASATLDVFEKLHAAIETADRIADRALARL